MRSGPEAAGSGLGHAVAEEMASAPRYFAAMAWAGSCDFSKALSTDCRRRCRGAILRDK
ncbi:hypothetical protein ABT373_14960 [Streptomyces sp. NPDC000070]|uniref:hypothetical protein n=1 Tax=Streptomyces sp. NPDC000070 TaxID=3154240 RepID=UPI0033256ABA